MREIKFRAWDKKKLLIRQVVDILFEAEAKYNVRLRFPVPGAPQNWELRMFSDVELMQYTGLKDKNGKEIYEGDILRSWYSRDTTGKDIVYMIFPVEYETLDYKGFSGFQIEFLNNASVIGNIYERPDLLNSEQEDKRSVATEAQSGNK